VFAQIIRRCYGRPWLLLSLCALFWAGNAVAGKLAVGEVSPMVLTMLRWAGACCVLGAIGPAQIVRDLKAVAGKLPFLLGLGAVGFTGFNAFLYLAAEATNGVNLLILQGATPILILLGAALFYHQRIGVVQALGVLLTLAGVVMTATAGEPMKLLGLSFNHGDGLMLLAGLCYAAYALWLKNKPVMPALSFFFALCLGAAFAAAFGVLVEWQADRLIMPSTKGWLIVLYCLIFPSLLAQIFFIRGVELIGAGRAGLCVNLIPVFGAFLMIGIGEPFIWSHAAAFVLVLAGVLLAESFRPPEVLQ
jgi:drug/metabolite transporter (DMT)-like permease